ncbi:MAG: CBS domain-containing protein [Deltaproteobacteria bacterium]|nr:MAG: CBS domain-containing protein [Deltaproteobacteria bacterium]
MLHKAEARTLCELTVADIMTEEVVTLNEDESMDLAETLMEIGRIRHLPVVDANGVVKGLVTHRDLLRMSISEVVDLDAEERREILSNIPVAQVMRREVMLTSPETSLLEAARFMQDHKYGCLPVVDEEGVLVGIVTEADFIGLTIRLLELARKMADASDPGA